MTGPPACVVGIRSAAGAAARFGERTGRPVHAVGSLDDPSLLSDHARSTLIVIADDERDRPAVELVMQRSLERRHPVGLLPLASAELDSADLVMALAEKGAAAAAVDRTVLYSDFLPDVADRHPDVLGRWDSAAFLAAARTGLDAAVVHSHGNGADLRIGTDVLCLRLGSAAQPARPSENALPCQSSGPCRLEHKTTFSAFHGPQTLGVRLLVLISCAGYHPHGGLLDNRYQLVDALLRGPRTAGIVTSTRVTFTSTTFARAALNSVRAGQPLGVITLRMNQSARFGPPSYVCLGDPDLRAVSRRAVVPPWPAAQARNPCGLLFAADALDVGAWPGPAGLSSSLRAAAARGGGVDGLAERAARAAAGAELGPVTPAWTAQFRPASAVRGPGCPRCGEPTRLRTHESLLYTSYRRVLTHCPTHGVLADRPASCAMPAVLGGAPRDVPRHAVVAGRSDPGGRTAVALNGDVSVWLIPGTRHG